MSVDKSYTSTKSSVEKIAVLHAGGDRKRSSNWRVASRGVMMLKFMEQKALANLEGRDDASLLQDFATEVFRR